MINRMVANLMLVLLKTSMACCDITVENERAAACSIPALSCQAKEVLAATDGAEVDLLKPSQIITSVLHW